MATMAGAHARTMGQISWVRSAGSACVHWRTYSRSLMSKMPQLTFVLVPCNLSDGQHESSTSPEHHEMDGRSWLFPPLDTRPTLDLGRDATPLRARGIFIFMNIVPVLRGPADGCHLQAHLRGVRRSHSWLSMASSPQNAFCSSSLP